MLLGVLILVLGEELVPLLLSSSTVGRVLAVEVVNFLGNSKALLGVEAELLLDLLDIVGLEGVTVNTVGTLQKRTVTDGGLELDQGGLVLDGASLLEGLVHGIEIVITVLDGDDVPAVGFVSLGNILSEGTVGVTIDGDVVVVPDSDEVAELKVTSQGGSLAGNTLHQATIAEEAVCVVVNQVKAGLVEGSGGVSLGHGQTDSVGDTLTQGASGDLNAGGVMGLRVTGSSAVNRLGNTLSAMHEMS